MKQNKSKSFSPDIFSFCAIIWQYYHDYGREFPWRNIDDPYKIVISEVMLQQTQTYRVIVKYEQFIEAFPSFTDLAQASLRDVLSVWQGLGYNRRGKYLHELAKMVMTQFQGKLPSEPQKLIALPGIGAATASSIAAFAFNRPTIFIETNIRTVFIHFFFNNRTDVHDKEIMPLVEKTVDHANPREWYYALMDYGVMLKKTIINPSRKSVHYAKQSKFEGSDRQIRGRIIHYLMEKKGALSKEVCNAIDLNDEARFIKIVETLIAEGMIKEKDDILFI